MRAGVRARARVRATARVREGTCMRGACEPGGCTRSPEGRVQPDASATDLGGGARGADLAAAVGSGRWYPSSHGPTSGHWTLGLTSASSSAAWLGLGFGLGLGQGQGLALGLGLGQGLGLALALGLGFG